MVITGHVLVMSSNDKSVPHIVRQDLKSFYLQTNDKPELKGTDSKKKSFCARLMICNSYGHLKLYFTSYNAMQVAISTILKAQGLEHRLAQYRHIKSLPDALICERSIVASRYCESVHYELKCFLKSDQDNAHVFDQELQSL